MKGASSTSGGSQDCLLLKERGSLSGCCCFRLCTLQGLAEMGEVLLPNLLVGNCDDRICVRVSRFWDFCDPGNETKLLHTDMVLIDEEGHTIHVQIYPGASQRFKQCIEEGNVYIFYYFRVKNSNDYYKPVDNDLMLVFTKWTKIENVVNVPLAFPVYAYSIASMEQLQARLDKKHLFTDVIGVITAISDVGAVQTSMRQGQSPRRAVTIRIPSNATLDVVLWSERATSFPAEDIHRDGQASPQIVIFVGTLVKSFGGMSLSSGSSCKWYINPEVPEAKKLIASAKAVHEPITWAANAASSEQRKTIEEKKVSEISTLNPFECKKNEFLVTVTVKKIDNSWWYNACKKCMKTAKRYGNSYKCMNPKCGTIGVPTQRYKLSILAGDETGDANFILFGRQGQRLVRKTADTLVADNPVGFIPDEITGLLEKTYTWSVSFTDSSTDSDNTTFQVNAVVGIVNDGGAVIPATPGPSQTSSIMFSEGASTSLQNTDNTLTVSSLHAAPETSLASSATPTKAAMDGSGPADTPQSTRNNAHDQDKALVAAADVPANSSTQAQKGATKKRSRPSPKKTAAKKLFIDEETGDDGGGSDTGVATSDRNSPSKDA